MRRLSNPLAYVVRAHPLDPSPERGELHQKCRRTVNGLNHGNRHARCEERGVADERVKRPFLAWQGSACS